MLFIYTLVLWLLLPWIFLRLLWRARKQPEYLRHIPERFGFYPPCGDGPLIWLHAVSVGETRATQNLVAQLRASYPVHRILLTHTTPTGRATGEQLYGDGVLRAYLPYDYPFAVKRFLRCYKPSLGILMETEIWFNLIRCCRNAGIPLLLLNARMSGKSARGYARFARLTRDALDNLSAVAAQTADDATRLTRLGAKNVAVMGNLKFDIEPPPAMLELGRQLRILFGSSRKVLLAASTREGEEALLLDLLLQLTVSGPLLVPDLLLVIVPRHPQRFGDVAGLIARHGLASQLRSDDKPVPAQTSIVLGDSMGEMFAYYAAADVAFIGGSLLPYGGQNLIEACAAGTPVVVGPHMYNFADATRQAVSSGAAVQVQNAAELAAAVQSLFADPAKLSRMSQQGAAFVASNRGATRKSLQLVQQLLR